MHTTQDERGLLNNFAVEPTLYFAEVPSREQQRQYWIQGVAAIAFVGTLLGIALAVS
ncbi:photosystem II assembly protein Psb34 [Altericista sp. CCNU0014]|uniref:photosystem II assembly protein Psb34 n=1 Tax=Altericista sp. CCNU0014 TaxID=3082949 RepID=UPI00384C3955